MRLARLFGVASFVCCAAVAVIGQSGAANGEWRSYGGDLGHTRYSPLDQINAANFSKLEVAWRFKTDSLGPRPEFQFEGDAADGRGRRLLDRRLAARGRRARRRHRRAAAGCTARTRARAARTRRGSCPGRGLAYWTDGREARILYVTPGYRLVALDAKTGALVAGFGENGVVDLKKDDDQEIDLITGEVGLHSTPIVAQERRDRRRRAPIGRRAARAGERERLRPRLRRADRQAPVDLPHDSAARRVRQRHVGEGLVDLHRQHRRVGADLGRRRARPRVPAGRTADRRLLRRPSSRATACSARASSPSICRPASASGTISSCTTASGTWTFRARRSSSTSRSTAGRSRRSRSRPSRRCCTSSIAITGQPIWPIEERPVAKGDVPGEWYAPTQPFPTKPPAYDRQGVSIDDLIDFTPELRAEAVKLVAKYKIGPIFTPPVVSKVEGPLGDAGAAVGDRRHQLAGRLVRSRDAHRSTSTRRAASARSAWCRRRTSRSRT